MPTEQIVKFQPDRTLYLRGFDGSGAAAALCKTSPTGFTVNGVFRDMADFCVLILYDADNLFEHYTVKYLPDFDLSGMVLSFDLHYQGLQPIDSPKFSWIDWAQMDIITETGESKQIELWDNATLLSGDYSVAQATLTFTVMTGGCRQFDRLTLIVNNTTIDFIANGGESASDVASWFERAINAYPWHSFFTNSVCIIASSSGATLTLKYARTGLANVSGTSVTIVDSMPNPNPGHEGQSVAVTSNRFAGLAPGDSFVLQLNGTGTEYTISQVDNAKTLTLTTPAATQNYVPYLAEYGGEDGNNLTVYVIVRTPNVNLSVDKTIVPFSGGSSDVTWRISLDFSALGIDQIRQAWLTFAPQLANGADYAGSEWSATFSNWGVADPNNKRTLQIAGPRSKRIGNGDSGCKYTGTGWLVQPANNYWRGFSKATKHEADAVTISYSIAHEHDLYLGTSLYRDRRIVDVNLDGRELAAIDCYLDTGAEVVTRRLVKSGVAAGDHSVTFTVGGTNGSAKPTQGEFTFLFDYLEAAVPTTDIEDAMVVYDHVSPAIDFDTDATYKMSPQRLLWHIRKLGFNGQLNEYLGVFWWNQRKRGSNSIWNSATIDFSQQTWVDDELVQIDIGGFVMSKTVQHWEATANLVPPASNGDSIANHFVFYINSASVSKWAEKAGPGKITIHPRTPIWGDTLKVATTPPDGATSEIMPDGNLNAGEIGDWDIDVAAQPVLNVAIREWHADLFREVKAAGLLLTAAFSMELVNPPSAWQARYYDGTPVTTDTGFASLKSSQCSFVPDVADYQKAAYTEMAGLLSTAGLTPWLQFGEYLWWFFSQTAVAIATVASTDPIVIGTVDPHGMTTGDRALVSGVRRCTAANGTWPVTVTDETHFTIPVASNGIWDGSAAQVRGRSMAYYDDVTKAAAQESLGRPLFKFTCQDDDPTVNNGDDARFLAAQLKAHIDSIRAAVLTQYPDAKFEILYPNDVNNPVCLLGPGVLYPQGGRLNAAVNLPSAFYTQETSGLDRFKMEALSWGATYLQMDLANQAIVFPFTSPMAWDKANVAYLVPWFNGICPWPREFHLAQSRGVPVINFWAYDHLSLMSWPLPLPNWLQRAFMAG